MSVHSFSHPLVTHKLSLLRDMKTNSKDFRDIVTELTMLLTYEATKDLELSKGLVTGWQGKSVEADMYLEKDPSIVPILRAGIGMQEGFLNVFPTAKISYIGYYRDHETLQPMKYYAKLAEDISGRKVYILDPMLATGGTTSAVCTLLKEAGCESIKVICVIAAPEGIARMEQDHPDVVIIPAVIDDRLDESGYIIPGLGDAGDRLFGTK